MNNLELYENFNNNNPDNIYDNKIFKEIIYHPANITIELYGCKVYYNDEIERLTIKSVNYSVSKNKFQIKNTPGTNSFDFFDNINWTNVKFERYNIYINGLDISHIEGLDEFGLINGQLRICNNKNLQSLQGSRDINIPDSDLMIYKNKNLKTLEGIENFKEMSSLVLKGNPYILDATIPIDLDVERESFVIFTEHLNGEFIDSDDYEMVDQLEIELENCERSVWDITQILKRFVDSEHIEKVIHILEDGGYDLSKPEYKDVLPDNILHLYSKNYKSTSGRDVAKLNTGQIYGIF